MHPVGKSIRWIEKWTPPFLMGTTSSITMQSLGKIALRAPAVGAKMWCLFLFVCHAPCPDHRAFEGCIVRTSFALPFIAWFRRGFQHFFQKGLFVRMHYIVRISAARWRHNVRKIVDKNCENPKIRCKSLCAPLRIDSWGFWKKLTAVV